MIVAAAVKFGDLITFVPRPGRHHHVLRACLAAGMPRPVGVHVPDEQGFIDHDGNFLTREEALKHALACGQEMVTHGSRHPTQLFSEDVWETPQAETCRAYACPLPAHDPACPYLLRDPK